MSKSKMQEGIEIMIHNAGVLLSGVFILIPISVLVFTIAGIIDGARDGFKIAYRYTKENVTKL